MKHLALLLAITCSLLCSACGPPPSQSDIQPLIERAEAVEEAKTSEYYMTYNVNGKKVILDRAIVTTFKNGKGFSLDGENNTQGDLTALRVFPTPGEVKVQTLSTAPNGLIFSLTRLNPTTERWETWSTHDMAKLSLGQGTIAFTEVTDTYVKGTFSFIANVGEEDGPVGQFDVTEGLFKARIVKY